MTGRRSAAAAPTQRRTDGGGRGAVRSGRTGGDGRTGASAQWKDGRRWAETGEDGQALVGTGTRTGRCRDKNGWKGGGDRKERAEGKQKGTEGERG